jgi:hypothetical protein
MSRIVIVILIFHVLAEFGVKIIIRFQLPNVNAGYSNQVVCKDDQ